MDSAESEKLTKQPSKKRQPDIFKIVIIGLAVVVLGGLIVAALSRFGGKSAAKGEYQDSNAKAVASFEIDVNFKRNCKDQKDCDPNKPQYDKVRMFVFDGNGQQVRVMRADKNGVFKAALPEGPYTLLLAKTFDNKEGLPQEAVELKKGKLLKLRVDYGTEMIHKSNT